MTRGKRAAVDVKTATTFEYGGCGLGVKIDYFSPIK
jgi:hypothetical protein